MWAPNCAEWMLAALGLLRAGAVLVPLNTRFKGGEAAYIIRDAGASTLVTVRGFLGADYPAMLDGQDTGDLARIAPAARREARGAGRRRPRRAGDRPRGVPRRRRGRRPGDVGGPGRRRAARRPLGPHLHLGHDRPSQGRGGDPRAVAADVRDVVVHRRAHAPATATSSSTRSSTPSGTRRASWPASWPAPPWCPSPSSTPAAVMARIGGRAHQRAAGTADPLPDAAGRPPARRATTCRRSGSGSPAPPWCRSSWCRRCATSSASTPC